MAGERARQAPPALEDLLFDGAIGKNGLKASRKNHASLRRTISQPSFRCDVFIIFVVLLSDRARPLSAKFFFLAATLE